MSFTSARNDITTIIAPASAILADIINSILLPPPVGNTIINGVRSSSTSYKVRFYSADRNDIFVRPSTRYITVSISCPLYPSLRRRFALDFFVV
jgi:hypothetical protein